MPQMGVSMYQAAVDIGLMLQVSARERTEPQWRVLLRSAGFRIVRIWWPAVSGTEAVIEAEFYNGDEDENDVEEEDDDDEEEIWIEDAMELVREGLRRKLTSDRG
ncbi:O-methyltransferase [Apiospora rasikravindrae]|uniref:O-methyltransferase n=1 Tax=Apiospora rasikravindrae TaxID=990691 RepID=A0ABR1U0A8_9PEZI